MALKGEAKKVYQREYMQRRRVVRPDVRPNTLLDPETEDVRPDVRPPALHVGVIPVKPLTEAPVKSLYEELKAANRAIVWCELDDIELPFMTPIIFRPLDDSNVKSNVTPPKTYTQMLAEAKAAGWTSWGFIPSSITPKADPSDHPGHPCQNCGGSDYWFRDDSPDASSGGLIGEWVCSRCHQQPVGDNSDDSTQP